MEKLQIKEQSEKRKLLHKLLNKGNAKSQDLENLIYQVKRKVFEKTGIKLELELKIIGEKL